MTKTTRENFSTVSLNSKFTGPCKKYSVILHDELIFFSIDIKQAWHQKFNLCAQPSKDIKYSTICCRRKQNLVCTAAEL